MVKQDVTLALPVHKQHMISHSMIKHIHQETKFDIMHYMSIIQCNNLTKELNIENNSHVNLFRNLSHTKTKTIKTLTMFYLDLIKSKLECDYEINKCTRKNSSSSLKLFCK